jgi:glycosyltransferase involved in cell wall biosynthesis
MHYVSGEERKLRDDLDIARADVAPIRQNETLSVVMPVHNALPYLDEAVRSILNQSHADFEFVIGDDASTDGSSQVLRGWAARDRRIRLFERAENLGPVGSSNWVVAKAEGSLIARMDADDVSHPDRLRRQLQLLHERSDAVLTGSPPVGIDRRGRTVREQTRWMFGTDGFGAPFAHGSIMYRRGAFDRVGGYRSGCDYWEDIDLYLRLAAEGRVLVLADPLYYYRFAETSARLTSSEARVEAALHLMGRCRECHDRGEDYGPLLAARRDAPPPGRLDPKLFLSFSQGQIWSGRSPGVLRRMLRRAAFPTDLASATCWLIALWGTISPRSLRYLMKGRLRLRNRRLPNRAEDGAVYEWRPRPTMG